MQKMMENMKKCSKCLEVKGVDEFSKNKMTKDGLARNCRVCLKEYSAKCYKENPYKMKESSKKYYKNNPDKMKEKSTKWHKNNPDKAKELNARWHKNNPDKVKELNARWRETLPDSFIKDKLKAQNYPQELINNPEFIEVKRLIIKTQRLCRTSRN